MTVVYFVRHGESTANQDGICAGQTDVELTTLGVTQAKRAGRELRDENTPIDIIITSPLKRARKTAEIIADSVGYPISDIYETQLAMERFRGMYEGQPSSVQDGATSDDYARMGAESVEAMIVRANRLKSYIQALEVQSVLVVSHNQFGRVFVAVCRGESPYKKSERLPNAHVFKL